VGLYVLIGRDGPRGAELRTTHRAAHLANLRSRGEAVRHAGPLLDETGAPVGSVVIFEDESLEAARRFAAGDPYVTGGVFARWEVLETRRVLPET